MAIEFSDEERQVARDLALAGPDATGDVRAASLRLHLGLIDYATRNPGDLKGIRALRSDIGRMRGMADLADAQRQMLAPTVDDLVRMGRLDEAVELSKRVRNF